MICRMCHGGARILDRVVGRKVSRAHAVVVLASIAWRSAARMHGRVRRELISSMAAIVRMVRLHVGLGVLVLDHLVWTGTDTAYCAVFALDCFAEGFCPAPAEEEEGAEEDRADSGNHDASYGALAQATSAVIHTR